jgi:hypothetical protein
MPVSIYVRMLLNLKMCSLLVAKLSFIGKHNSVLKEVEASRLAVFGLPYLCQMGDLFHL